MMCSGFWVGVITSIVFEYSISYSIFSVTEPSLLKLFTYMLFDGAIVSGIIWFMYLIQLNLERYVKDEI
jgi:hypothetical protein